MTFFFAALKTYLLVWASMPRSCFLKLVVKTPRIYPKLLAGCQCGPLSHEYSASLDLQPFLYTVLFTISNATVWFVLFAVSKVKEQLSFVNSLSCLHLTRKDNFTNSWKKIRSQKRTFPESNIIWSWSCDYFSCEWQPWRQHLDTIGLFCMR